MSEKDVNREKTVAWIKNTKILEPFLADYRVRIHGRQLAGLLKMNHATVSTILKGLEEKNILKSGQEGRNRKYYLNLDNFLTRNCIGDTESAKTMRFFEKRFLFKKMLSELAPIVLKEIPIVLFGSYAKESYTDKSDIDILVLGGDNAKRVIKALKEFGERQNKRIQVQKMTQKDFEQGLRERDILVLEIVKHHIILNNIPVIIDILWRYYNVIR